MAKSITQESSSRTVSYPVKQYGVFQLDDPEDPTGANAQLVHMAPDFNTAFEKLREHAGEEIGGRPDWGATDEVTSTKTYDILGHDREVRMRYEIDTLRPSGADEKGATIWKREREWLAKEYADRPNEHYGMYVDIDCHDAQNTKNFLLGGFTTLGEASDAMKKSAHAYLAAHTGARLMERRIELVDEKGEVRQRYQIIKGRWQYGEFVKEDAWLKKEAELRAAAYPSPPHIPPTAANSAKTRIMRLPSPSPSPVKGQTPHPQVTPHAQAQEIEVGEERNDAHWCTCHRPDDGNLMILCENDDCPIKWYHGRCVGVKQEPATEWWCPTCAPTRAPKPTARSKVRQSLPTRAATGKGVAGRKSKGKKKRKTG